MGIITYNIFMTAYQENTLSRKLLPSGTDEELFRYIKQHGGECEWGRYAVEQEKYNIR